MSKSNNRDTPAAELIKAAITSGPVPRDPAIVAAVIIAQAIDRNTRAINRQTAALRDGSLEADDLLEALDAQAVEQSRQWKR